jgi:hypothetical protein
MFFNGPSFGVGFAAGFGTGYFAREMTKTLGIGFKPISKAVVKTGIQLLEKFRETLSLAGETFEDLLAEARSELATAEGPSIEEATTRLEKAAASGQNNPKSRTGDSRDLEAEKDSKEFTKEYNIDESERPRSKKV